MKYILFSFLLFLSCASAEDKMTKEEMEIELKRLNNEYNSQLAQQQELAVPILKYDIEILQAALRVKVIEKYGSASVIVIDSITDEQKFLGIIASEYTHNSIFNPYGTYGSEYSSDSIWNEYGQYGGQYSMYSPFNEFTGTPPLIVLNGKIIGFLTVNKHINNAVDPTWLKTFFTH